MIGIISENNTLLSAACDILKPLSAEAWQPNGTYEAVVCIPPLPNPMPATDALLITVGDVLPDAALVIPTPATPADWRTKITSFLEQRRTLPQFENTAFLFDGRFRLLTQKSDNRRIPLTEKENALLCCLALAAPQTVSREDLLTTVWNYRADTETHTVESHIYALRQKIGPEADSLIQNNTNGYFLAGA